MCLQMIKYLKISLIFFNKILKNILVKSSFLFNRPINSQKGFTFQIRKKLKQTFVFSDPFCSFFPINSIENLVYPNKGTFII